MCVDWGARVQAYREHRDHCPVFEWLSSEHNSRSEAARGLENVGAKRLEEVLKLVSEGLWKSLDWLLWSLGALRGEGCLNSLFCS